jgi:hypothetical protein
MTELYGLLFLRLDFLWSTTFWVYVFWTIWYVVYLPLNVGSSIGSKKRHRQLS